MHAHTETRASPRPSRSAAERSRPASPVTQRAALLNPRAPSAGLARGQANSAANAGPQIVQRQPLTPAEAQNALAGRAPEFAALQNRIVHPWDPDGPPSNCHGYTLTGAMGQSANGDQVVAAVRAERIPGNVVVFIAEGEIAHSGRLSAAGGLDHLLIGVGVLNTMLTGVPEPYTRAFTLPAQLGALGAFLRPAGEAEEREDLIRKMLKTTRHAVDDKIPGADELQKKIYSLQDSPDRSDRDEIIADWRTFLEKHPKIEDDSDDDQ
jgi:hypothetical protein